MEIKAQRWIAVWYRCPNCGAQTANTRLKVTKRDDVPMCHYYQCKCNMEIVERKYYTTFVIEVTVSFTTVAGTLAQLGPFKVCDIVYPNIRSFRKWVAVRQAELAEQSRQYYESMRIQQEESAARLKCEEQERALLREVEQVAYRREHAVELEAEQIAQAFWPEEIPDGDVPKDLFGSFECEDDHPF